MSHGPNVKYADSVVKNGFLWSVTLLICLKKDRPLLPRPWKHDPSTHAMLSFIYGFMVWLFGLHWGELENKNPEPQWKCRIIKWVLTRSGGYVLRQLRWHHVWTFCLMKDVFLPHLNVPYVSGVHCCLSDEQLKANSVFNTELCDDGSEDDWTSSKGKLLKPE